MSSGKWCPFCLGLNVLRLVRYTNKMSHWVKHELAIIFFLICLNLNHWQLPTNVLFHTPMPYTSPQGLVHGPVGLNLIPGPAVQQPSTDVHVVVLLLEIHLKKYAIKYSQISNIRCTKSQNLNVSCLILQLSLRNPLKPGVKSIMKM